MSDDRPDDVDDGSAVDNPAVAPSNPPDKKPAEAPSRFDSAIWRCLWGPLINNLLAVGLFGAVVAISIKHIEFEDKIKAVGIASQVEIIKSDHTVLRELLSRLRRQHAEIDRVIKARAGGAGSAKVSDKVTETFAELDDVLHFAGVFIRHPPTSGGSSGTDPRLEEARKFIRKLHGCLAPDLASEQEAVAKEARAICNEIVDSYRKAEGDRLAQTLSMHPVDNAMIAIREHMRQDAAR